MEWAQQFVEQYGYWAVFAWTFIEGETVFIIAAIFAAAGILETHWVILIAAAGAFSGHMFFFALGRWQGMQIITHIPFLHRHYAKINHVLDTHAYLSVFVLQYLYGTRLAAAILFGVSKIEFWRFAGLQVINCISWACIIYTIGHLLGMAALSLLHNIGVSGLIAVIAIILILTIISFYLRHHKRSRP
ncbi:MAG: VTT domain-containing protein [Mariprofundales bacterium]